MTVQAQRRIDTAFERVVQYEIQAVQSVKFVAHDIAANKAGKRLLDALCGELFLEKQVVTGIIRPDRD